jgi:hypothetical protein
MFWRKIAWVALAELDFMAPVPVNYHQTEILKRRSISRAGRKPTSEVILAPENLS